MSSQSNVIDDMKTILEYYQALGFEALPIDIKEYGYSAGLSSDKRVMLDRLKQEIDDCRRCKLNKHRKNIVFGEGNPNAGLMFVGEAPGREEDIQGLPFVGDAGMLLTRLIEKMGMKRSDVYIANIIKCRPPLNRDPDEEEISSCRTFVERQIETIKPEVIITLGRIALQSLMNNIQLKISTCRGRFFEYKGIPLMPTFHPAYLLRNPGDKWKTWSDAQKVLERLKASGH